jgi:hypothetical protein
LRLLLYVRCTPRPTPDLDGWQVLRNAIVDTEQSVECPVAHIACGAHMLQKKTIAHLDSCCVQSQHGVCPWLDPP